MVERTPLVIINGTIQELPSGDTIPGGSSFNPTDANLNFIEEIDYTVASSSDEVDITDYNEIFLEWDGVTTASGEWEVNLSKDAGSNWYDTSGDYHRGAMYHSGSETGTAATGFRLGNGAGSLCHGFLNIRHLQDSLRYVRANGVASRMAGIPGVGFFYCDAAFGPFNRLRIRNASSNNCTAGKVQIYGRKLLTA